MKPKEKHGFSLWKNIYSTAEDFFNNCQFKIGKGDKIRLWEDKWCVQGPLSSLCHGLFNLSSTKNKSMPQAYISGGAGLNWDLVLCHRRRLYDSEIAELSILIPLLESIVIYPNQEDQLIWLGDKNGIFSVKAAYLK